MRLTLYQRDDCHLCDLALGLLAELRAPDFDSVFIDGDDALEERYGIRVPVLRAHSEALNIEFEQEPDLDEVYRILKAAPGVEVSEDRGNNRWPMPLDASGRDPVLVGRVRKDLTQPKTLDLWVVGDQIRKGAALNAVQIAEKLFGK